MEHENKLLALLDALREFEKQFGLRNRFNLFEAVSMVRQEIRHSSFLAFLLNPAESHGLGDRFLRSILIAAAENHPDPPISRLGFAVADCHDALVYRERDHFDITVQIPGLQLLLVIENKIDAGERIAQLADYRQRVQDRYPGFKFMGTFLTREGDQGEDDQWGTLGYTDVASELRRIVAEDNPSPAVSLAIQHYADLIERRIVVSPQIIDACRKIYAQHRVALDLVTEYGEVPVLAEAFAEFKSRHKSLQEFMTRSSDIHFISDKWIGIKEFQVAEPRWNTSCPVKFWFRHRSGKLFLRLEVGPVMSSSDFDRAAYVQELRTRVKGNEREVKPLFTRIRTHSRALSEEPDAQEIARAMEELWVTIGGSETVNAVMEAIPASRVALRG